MSGCLIALLVVGFLVLGSVGVGGWLLYREVGGFVSATGGVAKIMLSAQKAPGTDEMRKAGCEVALAIDAEALGEALQKFEDEIAKREDRKPKDLPGDLKMSGVILQCQSAKSGVDCQDVADAYRKAVKPKRNMLVSVTGKTSSSTSCSESFAPDGTKLGAATMPDLPE